MKKVLIFFLVAVAIAMILPSFADQVSKTLEDKDSTNDKTSFNPRNYPGFNNTFNATEKANAVTTTDKALTSAQIQTLKDTQNKLAALIDKIRGLKAKYANTKSKGLLNALDQFERQANQLNSEISAFIQNPNGNIDEKINSFVKREAALEHKVSIKEGLLAKMDTKQVNKKQVKESNIQKSNSIKEQKTIKKQTKENNKKNNNKNNKKKKINDSFNMF